MASRKDSTSENRYGGNRRWEDVKESRRGPIEKTNSQDGSATGKAVRYDGSRSKPENPEVVQGRAQQALRETQGDDECQVHWDQTSNAQPADEANYRRKGTSGSAFVEGSGSLARNPKRAKPYPGENWTDAPTVQWEDTEENHPYRKYDHSPSRKPDAKDPEPAPKGEYYTGARGESGITSTRLNRDSQGRLSTPEAAAYHNKPERRQSVNPGERAEDFTSAPTHPDRRDVATVLGPQIPEAEQQTERGTAGSDALLKQLGSNGYRRNV